MTMTDLARLLTRTDFDSDAEYRDYLDIENADYGDQPSATPSDRDFWKAPADEHINGEREKISLNVPKRNLSRLKARALEQGMPYQTLINAVLQQWLAKGQENRVWD